MIQSSQLSLIKFIVIYKGFNVERAQIDYDYLNTIFFKHNLSLNWTKVIVFLKHRPDPGY